MVWALFWDTCAMKLTKMWFVSSFTCSKAVTKSIWEFILSMIFFLVAISKSNTLSSVGVDKTLLFMSLWAMAQTDGPNNSS